MLFYALATLLAALMLSSTAAYFSVYGLIKLFQSAAIAVGIMGGSMEFGKIVASAWLHRNWKNNKVSNLMRGYMLIGIIVLMIITSTGIFGFLAAGHLEATAPVDTIQVQIDSIQQQINTAKQESDTATNQLQMLDKSLDVFFKNDRATQGLNARKNQEAERKNLSETVNSSNKKISELNKELTPLKEQLLDTSEKIGPIKYVAQLFFDDYKSHIDSAVQIVIMIIIFVFDPLAIILIIASSISFHDYFENKKIAPEKIRAIMNLDADDQPIEGVEEKQINEVVDAEEKAPKETIDTNAPFVPKEQYKSNNKARTWGYGDPLITHRTEIIKERE